MPAIYRAITTEWNNDNDSAVKDLVVTSDIFSFSRPSHIVEAFGEFHTSFMALNTVITDIKQRDMLLSVKNHKVRNLTVDSQYLKKYYNNTTTDSPNRKQKQLLSIVRQSHDLGRYVRMAPEQLRSLPYDLDGCVFSYQPPYRQGTRYTDPKFVKASLTGSFAIFVTQAIFHYAGNWLNRWWNKGSEPDWKETGVNWVRNPRQPGLYRNYNPSVWHPMASKIEKVSLEQKKSIDIGFPGGQNHRLYTEDKQGNNTIPTYWYPSHERQTWMGENPNQWYYDQQNRPQMALPGTYVSNPFNLLFFKDHRGKMYAQFFQPVRI